MKYIAGFFYRNGLDYLRLAIQSLKPYWKHTVVIDNTPGLSLRYEAPFPPGVKTIEPPTPLTFTQSMNYLIRMAEEQGCDAVIFMHNDVEAHPGTAEKFLAAVKKLHDQGSNWGLVTAHGYLLAALSMKAVKRIGLWDTFFPAIFSDYDYCQRIHHGGFDMLETYYPLTHHNGGSNTLKNDQMLWNLTAMYGPLWLEYYKIKWGGEPLHETYRIPFDPNSTVPPPTSWSNAVIAYNG
ncbi:glycosyltransferase family 2 protein [Paenibacillus sp. MSJ-34]|uniref:glycosyltransferase family 2 protein n=1 Tax=Paenibacillus sp. MSJ-34 TaxID=2841529 RepID=UPI001C0FF3B3|nr:glycosyltransferase family 2 protein [Paenibacillus sp. MSJ-34]MBU5440810.1 glycosyltransferase family 2 protein [Paenibacillus sp. MSJ-34]